MRCDLNQEMVIATYADGGVVASLIRPEQDVCYHYMCVFEGEDCARSFIEQHIDQPVFFQTKKLIDLAKEMNSSIVWPGIV